MSSRIILHVDMNAYFASAEQKAKPFLRGKPIVVVGDLSRRSVIVTASYEARAFGIKTGMVLHEAQKLCPRLIPVPGDFEKYLALSEEIRTRLLAFTDRMEATSCDEAFLDISSSSTSFDDADLTASRIQKKLMDDLEMPCSIGIAPNKLLAKLASDMKKPYGLTMIRPEDVALVMEMTPVQALCGIGGRTRKHLEEMGIRTCAQLGRTDFEILYSRFGSGGYFLQRMGQGRDDSPVARPDDPDTVKSIGHTLTFPTNTRDEKVIKSYLLLLSERVGRRLRKHGLQARGASVTLRYADFQTFSKQAAAGDPFNDDLQIHTLALKILQSFGALPKAVRLVGVSVSNLIKDGGTLFLWETDEKKQRAAAVMDRINRKYGERTLRHAGAHLAEKHGVLKTPIPPAMHS